MARLQILELPEGSNDDRPPFVLVIDQARVEDFHPSTDGETAWQIYIGKLTAVDPLKDMAEQIGARAVLVFETTVDIPANDVSGYLRDGEAAWTPADETRAILIDTLNEKPAPTDWQSVAEKRERDLLGYIASRERIERDRRASLTDALGMDRLRDWDDIRNTATALRKQRDEQAEAIERVRSTAIEPEIMNAQQEHPTVWMHGYACGVLAAKTALRPPTESQEQS